MTRAGRVPAALRNADWRFFVLAGATVGLAGASLTPGLRLPTGWPVLIALGALALTLTRADRPLRTDTTAKALWLTAVAGVAVLGGLSLGADRIASIHGGALELAEGRELSTRGFVTALPRRSPRGVSFRLDGEHGRLLVSSSDDLPELPVGREVVVDGLLAQPEPWQASALRRQGILTVLHAERVEFTGARRGGLTGRLDQIRDRAEAALERGMAPPEAALARGFVLGQDDRIDPRTVEDFKRSGLAHLLAVSGQNVLLLALLAMPFLAALGLLLRGRMLAILLLIAVYVPVAGAGPSIQRAGVMGAAGIVATLAGRPTSRLYAVLLAAFVTLAINPRAGGEVGWQLSFAAVIGILLWSAALRDFFLRRISRAGSAESPSRRALAEGFGMTMSATIATAPLMALHFDSVPLAALPANLLALPAVAPVMWLGMISAAAGQLPGFPVEPINALNGALIGYIAQIAHWLAAPDWALVSVPIPGAGGVAAAYGVMLGAIALLRAAARRRGHLGVRRGVAYAAAAMLALGVAIAVVKPDRAPIAAGVPGSLTVTVLDVGQGDAILLDPPGGDPVLVDTGPPEAEVGRRLDEAGIERLAALVLTHDQLDHSGGVADLLDRIEVEAVVHAAPVPSLNALSGMPRSVQIAAGDTLRSGRLALETLWPPPSLVDRRPRALRTAAAAKTSESPLFDSPPILDAASGPASGEPVLDDPNRTSIVLLARWRGFSMLLTADAEAEAVALDPGPLDVLKVAHHGSEDTGLAGLLARSSPAAAVISAGDGNRHGHPAEETLSALARANVQAFRTDADGDTTIVVGPGGWEIRTAPSS